MTKKFFVMSVKETVTLEEGWFFEAQELDNGSIQVTDMLSNSPYGEIFSKEDFENKFEKVSDEEYNNYVQSCEEGFFSEEDEKVIYKIKMRHKRRGN